MKTAIAILILLIVVLSCLLSPRDAFALLIDKVGKKGTWKRNPYVFRYEFKLK